MTQGNIFVDGPPYWVASGLGPHSPPGISVSPSNQSSTFDLTGTLTGDSVSMVWTWVNNPNPSPLQCQIVGTLNTTNNTLSGNSTCSGGASPVAVTLAERAVGLPIKYSGALAVFENSCLVSPPVQGCPSLGNDNVQVSFAMDASFNITATSVTSGVDNGTYTLSGPMIGNTMQLSGILGSQQVELVAYFDVKGAYGGSAQSLIVYQLAYPISTQATDNTELGYMGTLNPTN